MNDEIKEILYKLDAISNGAYNNDGYLELYPNEARQLLDYITNLQQENKIKDTNWGSLKYYLEKLYYKDYIEEAISDDIDKKIKELESKVEIKGYQKDIKALQQENERLKEENNNKAMNDYAHAIDESWYRELYDDYKSRCEKANNQLKIIMQIIKEQPTRNIEDDEWLENRLIGVVNILQNGSEKDDKN